MPRIQEYQSRVNAPGAVAAPKLSASDMGPVASALKSTAEGVFNVAQSYANVEKQRQEFEAQKAAMKEKEELSAWMDEQKKNAAAGGEGFAEKVQAELDARKEKALEAAPSEYARRAMDLSYSGIHLATVREAHGFEAESYARKQKDDLSNMFDVNNNLVRANPAKAQEFEDLEKRLIEKSGLDKTTQGVWMNQRRQSLYDSALDGEVTQLETGNGVTAANVAQYLAGLKSEGSQWVKNSSPDAYQGGVKRLERLQETLKERETQQIYSDFDEKMDQLQTTGVKTPQNIYTPQWIKANVKDPQKQEMMLKREAIASTVGAAMGYVKDRPIGEINEKLISLEKEQAGTDQFHVKNAEYKATLQALNQRNQEFKRDPVGYTLGASDAARNLQAAFAQNPTPELADQYAATVKAEQQRLYPGVMPSLLTKDQIGSIAAQMSAIKMDERGAIDAVNVLQGQQNTWGKHWPIVVRDLKANKAINDEQYIAATMLDKPHYRYVAEELVKASAMKEEEMLRQIPHGTSISVKEATTKALEPIRDTLKNSADGKQIYDSYHNALSKVLLAKSAWSGSDQSSLAEDYAQKIVLDGYSFEGSYRIPANQDASAIRDGADSVIGRLHEMDLELPGSDLRDPDVKTRYVKSLQREGSFATNGDETGLRLVDLHGRQVLIKKGGQTVPAQWTWGELKTLQEGARQEKLKKYGVRK